VDALQKAWESDARPSRLINVHFRSILPIAPHVKGWTVLAEQRKVLETSFSGFHQ
jgi:hypothetical protein